MFNLWQFGSYINNINDIIFKMLFLYFSGDGDLSNRTQFCVGENITFFCSGGGGSYDWRVPSLSFSLTTSISQVVDSEPTFGFTARRLSASRSSLNVIAFDRLNDTTISCVDGGNGNNLSSAIVGIFGM